MRGRSGMTTAALSLLNGYRSKGIKACLLTYGDNRSILHREKEIPNEWMIGINEDNLFAKNIVIIDDYEYVNNLWKKKYNCDITHHLESTSDHGLAFLFIRTPSIAEEMEENKKMGIAECNLTIKRTPTEEDVKEEFKKLISSPEYIHMPENVATDILDKLIKRVAESMSFSIEITHPVYGYQQVGTTYLDGGPGSPKAHKAITAGVEATELNDNHPNMMPGNLTTEIKNHIGEK